MPKKKWIDVEVSRNRRLWISSVLLPTLTIGATLLTIPQVQVAVGCGIEKVNRFINRAKNSYYKKKREDMIKGRAC